MFARCAFLLVIAAASPALADPCKAIPDRGPTPEIAKPGKSFRGRVVYIGDGDGICVATGLSQTSWIEVRLDDFYAPELREPGGEAAKAALTRLAYGREVTCLAGARSYDRVVAVCRRRDGESLGDLMRRAGVTEGGRAYRR